MYLSSQTLISTHHIRDKIPLLLLVLRQTLTCDKYSLLQKSTLYKLQLKCKNVAEYLQTENEYFDEAALCVDDKLDFKVALVSLGMS